MKPELTINNLITEAKNFCISMSNADHPSLYGVTDGKAIGTYVEHLFQMYLSNYYNVIIGNSASGIDLPGEATGIFLKESKVGPVELRNNSIWSKI